MDIDAIIKSTIHKDNQEYFKKCQNLTIKQVRMIYSLIRKASGQCESSWFLPSIGITFGEFCIFQIVKKNKK